MAVMCPWTPRVSMNCRIGWRSPFSMGVAVTMASCMSNRWMRLSCTVSSQQDSTDQAQQSQIPIEEEKGGGEGGGGGGGGERIMCEACKGTGWLICDFCEGQKTNIQAKNNRIYRRCPTCKAVGYVLCSKCKVYKCVTFPDFFDEDTKT